MIFSAESCKDLVTVTYPSQHCQKTAMCLKSSHSGSSEQDLIGTMINFSWNSTSCQPVSPNSSNFSPRTMTALDAHVSRCSNRQPYLVKMPMVYDKANAVSVRSKAAMIIPIPVFLHFCTSSATTVYGPFVKKINLTNRKIRGLNYIVNYIFMN